MSVGIKMQIGSSIGWQNIAFKLKVIARYSESSLIRRVVILKVRILRRFVIPKVRYPKVHYSEGSIVRK